VAARGCSWTITRSHSSSSSSVQSTSWMPLSAKVRNRSITENGNGDAGVDEDPPHRSVGQVCVSDSFSDPAPALAPPDPPIGKPDHVGEAHSATATAGLAPSGSCRRRATGRPAVTWERRLSSLASSAAARHEPAMRTERVRPSGDRGDVLHECREPQARDKNPRKRAARSRSGAWIGDAGTSERHRRGASRASLPPR
jgi:hypothetical protein